MGDMSENTNCTNPTALKLDKVETQYTTEWKAWTQTVKIQELIFKCNLLLAIGPKK
jgi:hypothetical protein